MSDLFLSYLEYPILSYLNWLVLSPLVLSYLSHPIWSYLIFSYLILPDVCLSPPGVFQPRNLHPHGVLKIPKQRLQLLFGFAIGFSAHILWEGHMPWQIGPKDTWLSLKIGSFQHVPIKNHAVYQLMMIFPAIFNIFQPFRWSTQPCFRLRVKGPKLRGGTAACDSTSHEVGGHVWREQGRLRWNDSWLEVGKGWNIDFWFLNYGISANLNGIDSFTSMYVIVCDCMRLYVIVCICM